MKLNNIEELHAEKRRIKRESSEQLVALKEQVTYMRNHKAKLLVKAVYPDYDGSKGVLSNVGSELKRSFWGKGKDNSGNIASVAAIGLSFATTYLLNKYSFKGMDSILGLFRKPT